VISNTGFYAYRLLHTVIAKQKAHLEIPMQKSDLDVGLTDFHFQPAPGKSVRFLNKRLRWVLPKVHLG